ncbi:Helicase protein with RING/U-box domain [Salix suchowensis]|nr:Helicase protein with RING/U-box domain [Salix suchowensis]
MDTKSREDPPPSSRIQVAEGEKPVVFKKWQHPAAPFCYESAPFKPSFFVPV